ncbi:HTH domain protein [Aquisphaera giovannonii]|uniref:HTH domain protein n=1 Tax=Aquisphaera giovannonii TaxID=406548 RepID=A0A5B9W286_9BACT|nr:HTH domain-containing protein [Aquisphaera giovannonii]QEH34125.1 HTH domain protein [Aquisphaera giovannonii]
MGKGTNAHQEGAGLADAMGNAPRPSHFPLLRLLQLLVLLQTERYPNARRLAEICEVSRRTIYRDLAMLDEAGIPILYRPERQGYQLARRMFLTDPRIEEHEALALLILSRNWAAGEDLGLSRAAGSAVQKVLQALPEPLRDNLLAAAEVVGDRPAEGAVSAERTEIHSLLLKSLSDRRHVRIWLTVAGSDAVECTKLAIYRLSRIDGQWCLVGRSSRHADVCLIPMRSVSRAESTEEAYSIPPRFNLERFLEQARPAVEGRPHLNVG